MKKLKELGCVTITFGIEYGTENILKKLNKGTTIKQVKNAIALARKYKIAVSGGMLTNIPGEKVTDIKKSTHFLYNQRHDYYNTFYAPKPLEIYPGTKIEKEWRKNHSEFRWTKFYFNKKYAI